MSDLICDACGTRYKLAPCFAHLGNQHTAMCSRCEDEEREKRNDVFRSEGAAAERDVLSDWFAAIADMARDIDPFVSRAADFAANAISLGRLGPPPGATNDPATARATKPATPWTLEAFRKRREEKR